MKLTNFQSSQSEEVISLFRNSFGDSEGETEGTLIGNLVQNLIGTTPEHDLYGYCAEDGKTLLGCIFFSRFSLAAEISAFMLSPVAVSTPHQGIGVGQTLINFGLEQMKLEGVELVVTYGDPNYYSRVGFESITENTISAPYSLTYPEGWQAKSLTSASISPVNGKTHCVQAFRKQEYW